MHSAWNAWVFLGETTYPKHNTYESRNSMFTLFKQRRLGFCIISCAWIAVAFQKDIRREELLQWPSKKRRLPVWYRDSFAMDTNTWEIVDTGWYTRRQGEQGGSYTLRKALILPAFLKKIITLSFHQESHVSLKRELCIRSSQDLWMMLE